MRQQQKTLQQGKLVWRLLVNGSKADLFLFTFFFVFIFLAVAVDAPAQIWEIKTPEKVILKKEVMDSNVPDEPSKSEEPATPEVPKGSNESDEPGEPEETDEFDEFDEFEAEDASPVQWDPLSPVNRFITRSNDRLYVHIFRPMAVCYNFIFSEPTRIGISRFFTNLRYPIRVVNNILQLKNCSAEIETRRFLLNTTLGVAGFMDPAKEWCDMDPRPEDFGQTLGHYGVGSGFPVVFPVFGPSNLRDTISMFPDSFFDPINYLVHWEAQALLKSEEKGNGVSLMLPELDSIRVEALDLYVFIRDAYEQHRNKLIAE